MGPPPQPHQDSSWKGGGGSWGGEASYRPLIWEEKTICLYLTNNFLPKIWGKWDPNPIRTRTESKRGPGRGAERQRTWSQPACGTCTACRPRSTIPLHPACLTPSFNYHSLLLRVNFGVPLCIVLGGWGGEVWQRCALPGPHHLHPNLSHSLTYSPPPPPTSSLYICRN